MKPELRFERQLMRTADLGEGSSVPDYLGGLIFQNNQSFRLDEDDEIYEGYGRRRNSYPYVQRNCYSRKLEKREVLQAILENDYVKAAFLPEMGGRLWSLTDKKTGKQPLYSNDVLRFSNLAICNAWFSGGVEWNIGMIGHTPFTTEQLHTARLKDDEGNPVLRMYAYERVREVEYQMDFWLGQDDTCLNCRMRIVNSGSQVVPMYWWSNMAVPHSKGGRVIVPAREAYTSDGKTVYKTPVPQVGGIDISRYENIPSQVDYFFNIPRERPKYIAHVDERGYGLLQMSTGRLQGRKMFSWGDKPGGHRWQEFLTEEAGPYLEIQAGLGKTQYGCIPMAPHTAWEWMEQYCAVELPRESLQLPYEELEQQMTGRVEELLRGLEDKLAQTRRMALRKGKLICKGTSHGTLKRITRQYEGERDLSPHLEYGECSPALQMWADYLKEGILPEREPLEKPGEFMCDRIFYDRLRRDIEKNGHNWFAHYHLGAMHMNYNHVSSARKEFLKSLELAENPWAYHGLAVICILQEEWEEARRAMAAGLNLKKDDLSYVKEGIRLLITAEGFRETEELYRELPREIQEESRVSFYYMKALVRLGQAQKARELLRDDFILEDLRECEDTMGELYTMIHQELYDREPEEIPFWWDFQSL